MGVMTSSLPTSEMSPKSNQVAQKANEVFAMGVQRKEGRKQNVPVEAVLCRDG